MIILLPLKKSSTSKLEILSLLRRPLTTAGGVVNCLMRIADKRDGMYSPAILYAYFSSDISIIISVNASTRVIIGHSYYMSAFFIFYVFRLLYLFLIVKSVFALGQETPSIICLA